MYSIQIPLTAGRLWFGNNKEKNSYASPDMNFLLIERVIDYLASLLLLGRLFHFGGSIDSELSQFSKGCAVVVIYSCLSAVTTTACIACESCSRVRTSLDAELGASISSSSLRF